MLIKSYLQLLNVVCQNVEFEHFCNKKENFKNNILLLFKWCKSSNMSKHRIQGFSSLKTEEFVNFKYVFACNLKKLKILSFPKMQNLSVSYNSYCVYAFQNHRFSEITYCRRPFLQGLYKYQIFKYPLLKRKKITLFFGR